VRQATAQDVRMCRVREYVGSSEQRHRRARTVSVSQAMSDVCSKGAPRVSSEDGNGRGLSDGEPVSRYMDDEVAGRPQERR
jgi:hypothetical protein